MARALLCLGLLAASSEASLAFIPSPSYGTVDLAAVQPFVLVPDPGGGAAPIGRGIAFGDVDGDGLVDMVVSSPGASPLGRSEAGAALIVYGVESPAGILDLSALRFTAIAGSSEYDNVGTSLAVADFNGDGYDDVAVGAPNIGVFTTPRDTVYIVWGGAALPAGIAFATPNPLAPVTEIVAPSTDFSETPISRGLGFSLATGDFNGDGTPDLVIGAPFDNDGGQFGEEAGSVFVVYGDQIPATGVFDLTTAAFGARTHIDATNTLERFGAAVAAGDFDGDGRDDVGIGAPGYVPNGFFTPQGRAYLVLGRIGRPSDIAANGDPNTTVIEPNTTIGANGRLGTSIAMGRHTRDLWADLLIGAPGELFSTPSGSGSVYLVAGTSPAPTLIDLNTPGAGAAFIGNGVGDRLGAAVGLFDLDGDGLDDAIMGAPGDNISGDTGRAGAGAVYARRSFGSLPVGVETMDENAPFTARFLGRAGGDALGHIVAGGDFSNDGLTDIFMGAPNAPDGFGAGEFVGLRARSPYPRLVSATVAEQTATDLTLSEGDQILLSFDRAVDFVGGPTDDSHWFLTNIGATLGTGSTASPSARARNVVAITLGSDFGNIVVPGRNPTIATAIDIAAGNPLGIANPFSGLAAIDGGVGNLDDVAVDIRWQFQSLPMVVGGGGGVVGIGQNTSAVDPEFDFTRHSLAVPAGSLASTAQFQFGPLPASMMGAHIPSGVQLTTNATNPVGLFSSPAVLTLEYRDEDIDLRAGQIEGLMRLFQLGNGGLSPLTVQGSKGEMVPLAAGLNAEDNTVSAEINGLNASGGGGAGTYATLPVNPVEERSANIAPDGSGGAVVVTLPVPLAADGATLSGGATGGYLLHEIEFPGYAIDDTAPNRINVTIRTATLFERTWPTPEEGANLFPTQSGSIFVVETRDAGNTLTPFTAPVNITVEYQDRADPVTTDIIDFDSTVEDSRKMRIVRSRVDASSGPNYQFISESQTNSPTNGAISVQGITNLTDANGQAVWGAIANTAVTLVTLEEIVQHILGETTLVGDLLSQANANGGSDNVVDAADVVTYINNP